MFMTQHFYFEIRQFEVYNLLFWKIFISLFWGTTYKQGLGIFLVNLLDKFFPVKFVLYDLTPFGLKYLFRRFDKYAVVRTEHDALVKTTKKIFQILWPSQKTLTLIHNF